MIKWITLASLLVLVAAVGDSAFAGQPPGLENQGKVPPGFNQGKKTGWQGAYPPGWAYKSDRQRREWEEAVHQGRKNVYAKGKEKGLTNKEAERAADDYEKAVRRGLDPREGESLVKDEIEKGKKGKGLSDSVTKKSDKRLEKGGPSTGKERKGGKGAGKTEMGAGKGTGKGNNKGSGKSKSRGKGKYK